MKSGVVFVCVFLCILQFKVGQSAHYTQIEIEIPTRTKNLQNSQWKKKVPYPIAKHEHCCDSCHGSCYDSHRRTGNPPKFESQSNTYILSIPLANCHTTTVTIDATHRPSKNAHPASALTSPTLSDSLDEPSTSKDDSAPNNDDSKSAAAANLGADF